jgi:phosphonopyruvate decarboxylase
MLQPSFFIGQLKAAGIDFFAGVPDSLLKNICAYITDNLPKEQNIIAANEGGAMGIAAGYHLSTGKIGVVYMQNSGEGNIINPLASLTDREVYNIPVLLLIGWRGRPGVHDEPQHVKQGKVTTGLLNTMGIDYSVLSKDETQAAKQIAAAVNHMTRTNEPYALVIEKDTFEAYTLQSKVDSALTLSREEAIETVVEALPAEAAVVSTTGMISRELFEIRERRGEGHGHDFLTVGSMGHASQIALGIALQQKHRPVFCFDGDGASIMHMGNMAITAQMQPKNMVHVVFNNGAHDSVGGQPTVGLDIDLPAVARAVGYRQVCSVKTKDELRQALTAVAEGPVFLEVQVRKGNRKDLGRPTTTPVQNKEALMAFLSEIGHCQIVK